MAYGEVGRVTLSVTVRAVAVARPAGRPGVNAEEGRLVTGSVSLWVRGGERSYPLRSPPTFSSLRRGKSSQITLGVGGKGGKGRAPNHDGRGPGGSPAPSSAPPAPRGAETESPARGRSQAVNAPSRPVLPTGPSPPPHLKTLERLHHGLDALLGRPPRQPPRRGQRLRKPGPVPATALPLFRETWKGSEDPKTEWLPSCLSGRQPRAATWRLLRRRRRRPRGPRVWPRPLSARDETGRGRPCA